jgi:uncharacterized lipoprotein YddW (UPF0748 family)
MKDAVAATGVLMKKSVIIFYIFILLPSAIYSQVVIADAVKLVHSTNHSVPEIIVDNSESDNFFSPDSWKTGSTPGGYLDNYIFTMASETSLITAYWKIDIQEPGYYNAFTYYLSGSNRSSNVLYRITHSGGVSYSYINQETGGNWENLGHYKFDVGLYLIQICTYSNPDIINDVIIDDGDILFSRIGAWHSGSVTQGYQDDYLYINCSPTSNSEAIWHFPAFKSGNYEIYFYYTTGRNRNPLTNYVISHSCGTLNKLVDQSEGGDGWHYFGTYPFNGGVNSVKLNNTGILDKVIIADAMKFILSENQEHILPRIMPIFDIPPTPDGGEPFTVRAKVESFDPLTSVFAVQENSKETTISLILYDDGLHNDNDPDDMIYGGELPGGEHKEIISYSFYASTEYVTVNTDKFKCLVAYDDFTSPELRMVFCDARTSESIDLLLKRVRSANFNTLLYLTRSSANTTFISSYEPMKPGVPEGFDPLGYLIKEAHDTSGGKAYIAVHCFVLVYVVLGTDIIPPGHVLDLHPEWISEDYSGATYIINRMYLDQGVPEVQDYLVKVFSEIIENYDIDGFNLDFIRYREQKLGYNPAALGYFQQEYNRNDRPPIDDPEWCYWRRQQVTNLVKRVHAVIQKNHPEILLTIDGVCSGDPESIIENNSFYWRVYQDYPLWLKNHYIDGVLGMAYKMEHVPDGSRQFETWMDFLQDNKYDRESVPIVGGYKNYTQNSIIQLHKLREKGINWLTFFMDNSPNMEYLDVNDFYSAIKSQIFPSPVSIPVLPWKENIKTGNLIGKVFYDTVPARLTKIKLSQEEITYTDLCGFYCFFELNPGNFQLEIIDDNDQVLESIPIVIEEGITKELNINLNTGAYWTVY